MAREKKLELDESRSQIGLRRRAVPLGRYRRSARVLFRNVERPQARAALRHGAARSRRAAVQAVLDYVEGNQSRAAEMLGINRNTLRKKLQAVQAIGLSRANARSCRPPRAAVAFPTRPASSSSRAALAARGVELLSTGGTAQAAADAGLPVHDVGELHRLPRDHGRPRQDAASEGARRPARRAATSTTRVDGASTASRRSTCWSSTCIRSRQRSPSPDCTLDDAIENIDIGGPAMVRAAAKNSRARRRWSSIRRDYAARARRARRATAARCRQRRASRSRRRRSRTPRATTRMIASYLPRAATTAPRSAFRDAADCSFDKVQDLRYGENPHQQRRVLPRRRAARRARSRRRASCRARSSRSTTSPTPTRRGNACAQFDEPACVIVKHANPCGVARRRRRCARPTNAPIAPIPTSAFGGIIAFNRALDARDRARRSSSAVRRSADRARRSTPTRSQCSRSKAERARARDRRRSATRRAATLDFKRVGGGLLVQTRDIRDVARSRPARSSPSARRRRRELADLLFAWRVAQVREVQRDRLSRATARTHRHRRRPDEPRRFGAHRRASRPRTPGSTLARLGRWPPMRSSRSATASTSPPTPASRAVIQPGGSMRDDEVIAAADEHGIAMVFTGMRHFRH